MERQRTIESGHRAQRTLIHVRPMFHVKTLENKEEEEEELEEGNEEDKREDFLVLLSIPIIRLGGRVRTYPKMVQYRPAPTTVKSMEEIVEEQ